MPAALIAASYLVACDSSGGDFVRTGFRIQANHMSRLVSTSLQRGRDGFALDEIRQGDL